MGELLKQIQSAKIGNGRKSELALVFEILSPEDRADLVKAIKDPTIPAAAISRALAARDIKLLAPSITRYRRGESANGLG